MGGLEPLYTAENCRPAYELLWSLSIFWKTAAPPADGWLGELAEAVERDGVRILEHHARSPVVTQFLLSTTPHASPAQIIRSVKGRFQYLVRDELPKAFHRNYAIRSIGSSRQEVIENYVACQLDHHPMADHRAQEMMSRFQIHNAAVDLGAMRRSEHGEFSYNLHIVLVNEGRWRGMDESGLAKMRQMILKISEKKGHLLSRAGIVADHIHLALGCGIDESPLAVALSYLNNLAYARGMQRIYQYGFYVGTFGEYDLGAVRQALRG